MRKTKRTICKKLNKRRRTKQRRNKKVGGASCYILTEKNEIKDGLDIQCKALHDKIINPKKHVDKISEISEVYTKHDTFLYQGKTGLKFPISSSSEILQSMLNKNCYLLTGYANHYSQPIIEIGNPDQCDALKQKIKNKNKILFPNDNTRGKPAQILEISQKFTDHNIFTYVSSTGDFNFISDNILTLQHFSHELFLVLQELYKRKNEEEGKISKQKLECYLLLGYNGDGFHDPIIEKGYPHQCDALKLKLGNNDQTVFPNKITPGKPPQILEIHPNYTDVRIFTYISSTGTIHFISDDKDKLKRYSKALFEYFLLLNKQHTVKKHTVKKDTVKNYTVVDQCYLLKLDEKEEPIVLKGYEFQRIALEQKINNDDIEVFKGKNAGEKINIYGLDDNFTREHVFQYKSSQGIFHVISDNLKHFDPPNQLLINYLLRNLKKSPIKSH
jgi:hypothetical protein